MKNNTMEASHSCCSADVSSTGTHVDPICGMQVDANASSHQMDHDGQTYYFCSKRCLEAFSLQKDKTHHSKGKNRAVFWGVLGSIALLLVFITVVILSNPSLSSAFGQFARLWYWVLLLSLGFGFQLGLFFHIRFHLQQRMAGATAEVAASGAVSTGSMLACCSHGLVNLLPMLGVSAAAAFLARYQLPFILLGVFSNLVGVTIMLGIAQKYKVGMSPILSPFSQLNLKVVRRVLVAVGILAILFSMTMV